MPTALHHRGTTGREILCFRNSLSTVSQFLDFCLRKVETRKRLKLGLTTVLCATRVSGEMDSPRGEESPNVGRLGDEGSGWVG